MQKKKTYEQGMQLGKTVDYGGEDGLWSVSHDKLILKLKTTVAAALQVYDALQFKGNKMTK